MLVIHFPTPLRSAVPLLRASGWDVTEVRAYDGVMADTPTMREQVARAAVVVLSGATTAENDALAGSEWFRATLRPGAAVVMHTPDSRRVFYALEKWGEGDQGVTTPATCEMAVRASVQRAPRTGAHRDYERMGA